MMTKSNVKSSGISADTVSRVPIPVIPRGWNSPVLKEVTVDTDRDSIALSLEIPGYKRVLAVFYMNDDWGKVKLAQLMNILQVELLEDEVLDIHGLKDVFDHFIGQEINFVCFKHRKVIGRRGQPQTLAAFWFSAAEKHEFDADRSFVDETTKKPK